MIVSFPCVWCGVGGPRFTSMNDKGFQPCLSSATVPVVYSGTTARGSGGQASRAPRSMNIIFFFKKKENTSRARLAVWDDSVVTGTMFSLKKAPKNTEGNRTLGQSWSWLSNIWRGFSWWEVSITCQASLLTIPHGGREIKYAYK